MAASNPAYERSTLDCRRPRRDRRRSPHRGRRRRCIRGADAAPQPDALSRRSGHLARRRRGRGRASGSVPPGVSNDRRISRGGETLDVAGARCGERGAHASAQAQAPRCHRSAASNGIARRALRDPGYRHEPHAGSIGAAQRDAPAAGARDRFVTRRLSRGVRAARRRGAVGGGNRRRARHSAAHGAQPFLPRARSVARAPGGQDRRSLHGSLFVRRRPLRPH